MQFGLSENQEFLKDTARKFFTGECPSVEMRRLMETDTAYDEALWSKLTDQGYTGIIFPEAYGGVALGKVELLSLIHISASFVVSHIQSDGPERGAGPVEHVPVQRG